MKKKMLLCRYREISANCVVITRAIMSCEMGYAQKQTLLCGLGKCYLGYFIDHIKIAKKSVKV